MAGKAAKLPLFFGEHLLAGTSGEKLLGIFGKPQAMQFAVKNNDSDADRSINNIRIAGYRN